MKKNFRLRLLTISALPLCGAASGLDLHWDANGNANTATGGGGTWITADTWRTGSDTGTLGNWADGNNAVFGGTSGTVTLGGSVSVTRLTFNTAGFNLGEVDNATHAISFSGSYTDANPAIAGSSNNTSIRAKITGSITGGLIIGQGAVTPPNLQRFLLSNPGNDFTGNIHLLNGNLAIIGANGVYGNVANKIILNGGGLSISQADVSALNNLDLSRAIEVGSSGGNLTGNATSGSMVLNLSGAITGSGTWNLYRGTGGGFVNPTLSGDMSGFTGACDIKGGNVILQASAASSGSWVISGGTLKLNTTDNSHIADGAGKANLLMNGGKLDLNGKNETINGLSGPAGIVENQLPDTHSTLTIGAGDATASFGGTILDSNGTVALTKIGTGTQTLGGVCTFTGATTIKGGSLTVGGSLEASPVTVETGAALAVTNPSRRLSSLTLQAGTTLSVPLADSSSSLMVDTGLTLSGGTVTLKPIMAGPPEPGNYELLFASGGISGSATLVADFGSSARVDGSASINGGAVIVTIASIGADLTWNNHSGTAIWDSGSSVNFLNTGANDVFKMYDTVTFGPSSPAGEITLAGLLVPAAVTVDSSSNFTFSGAGSIGGNATLTKDGSGTLTVDNDNIFTGYTTVYGGTLAVNGSLGASEVLVTQAGTLGGTGSIGGKVTIEGILSPGDSVGTLTVTSGGVDLSGTYACDVDGSGSDKLAVTGNLNLTDATLELNFLSPGTAPYHVIATYTGLLTGNFTTVPAGYFVDTSEAGKVVLRAIPVVPAGMITFEPDQGYPAGGEVSGTTTATDGGPFSGIEGWSLYSVPTSIFVSPSSGEYLGGASFGASDMNTYIGGKMGGIQRTGTATLVFDSPFEIGGTSVGFMADTDHDGLFDRGHPSGGVPGTGLSFGIGGNPARFQYRDAGLSTEHPSPGAAGIVGHWYRHTIIMGESIGGNRTITWSMRDLTEGSDVDFNLATPEVDNWTFTVTDSQFGISPEQADGIFVRATALSRVDNIRATSAEPPQGTAYDTWLRGFPSLTGGDRLPDADPDHDGVKNMLEFVLNGNPTTSDPAILPMSSKSGSNLVFTFHRRDDSESLMSQTVQYGTNLTAWTDVVIGAENGSSGGATYTVAENGGAPDLITVTIPTGGEAKIFARLLVTEAP